MSATRIRIDPDDPSSLPEGRIDRARGDATTVVEIAVQQHEDEAMSDMPRTAATRARASEARLHGSLEDAVMPVLGTSAAKRTWVKASFDLLWDYGEFSPFEVALDAWKEGDMELYEAALADDAWFTEIEEAARE